MQKNKCVRGGDQTFGESDPNNLLSANALSRQTYRKPGYSKHSN